MTRKAKIFLYVIIAVVVIAVLIVIAFVKGFFGGGVSKYDRTLDYAYDGYEESAAPMMDAAPAPEGGFAMPSYKGDDNAASSQGDVDVERMIIKTGSLSMIVEDVREAIKKITDYANTNGGYVVSSNVNKYDLSVSGEITVRIPVAVFESGISEVKTFGEVTSEDSYGQDVTEEFVDLEARLNNLKASEAQFLEIMKKATKIEDILAVQTQLTYVRGEIESYEGRMKYLSESAKLSTLTVYLSTDPATLPLADDDETWKPFATLKDAFRSLLDFGKGLVEAGIWVVVYIPALLIGAVLIWVIVKIIKRIFRRKTKK